MGSITDRPALPLPLLPDDRIWVERAGQGPYEIPASAIADMIGQPAADLAGTLAGKADLDSTGKLKASQIPVSALVDVSATGMTISGGVLTLHQDGGPDVVIDLNSFATDAEVSAALAGLATPAQIADAIAAHGALADPHPGKYAAPSHTHAGLMTASQSSKLDALPAAADLAGTLAGKADLDSTGKLKASQIPVSALVDVSATGMTISGGVLTLHQDGGPDVVIDLNSFATDAEVSAALAGLATPAQIADAIAAHGTLADPHPGKYAAPSHTHDAGSISGLGPLATMTIAQAQASVSGDCAKLTQTQQAQQIAGAKTALLNATKTALVDPSSGADIPFGGVGSAIVTLPAGATSLSTLLTNTVRAIRQAASHKHCIIVIDSDSTSNGLCSASAPIYPLGSNLLNDATVMGAALESAGVKVNRTRWSGQMSMQSLGSSNGLTDPRVGGTYTETLNQSVVCGGWNTITVGNKRSYIVDSPVDRVQLIYITNGSGSTPGNITVDVNGGAALYSASQAVAASTVVTAPINLGGLLKPGDVINVNATVGTVFEIGIMAYNSHQPGVTIINNGGSGKSAQQGAATGGFNSRALYAALNTAGTPAALVLIHLILNSLGNDSTTYQGYLQTMCAQIKAASSATDVVFYDGPQCGTAQANSANYPTRVSDAKAVASVNNCAYISANNMFGASPGTGNIWYISDNVGHMTPLGTEEKGRAVIRPIIDAVRSI